MNDRVRDHFDGEAPNYDDLIVKLIPGYHEQHDVILAALPFPRDAALRALDLGCGTGALSRLVLEAFPNARVEATDVAPGMLQQCAANLSAFGDRISTRELDFAEGGLGSGWDLVISGLAIHHVDDEEKRALFARVFAALAPGGMFLMRDTVTSDTPEDTRSDLEAWKAFMSDAGEDAERWFLRYLGEDKPSPLSAQLTWLTDAGFADVTCYWRRINFAVFGGRKP